MLGWVGLATIGNHNTGDWVYQRLYEMDAVNLPLDQIVGNLTGLATRDFAQLPVPALSAADKRSHFVLGGWRKDSGPPQAFFGVIYNDLIFHPGKGHKSATLTPVAVADPRFLCTTGSFAAVKRPYHVFPIGDYTPRQLSAHFSGLKTLMKRRAGVREIGAACRMIALEAARHTTTISRNLISVEMEYGGVSADLKQPRFRRF